MYLLYSFVRFFHTTILSKQNRMKPCGNCLHIQEVERYKNDIRSFTIGISAIFLGTIVDFSMGCFVTNPPNGFDRCQGHFMPRLVTPIEYNSLCHLQT
jgi:hypothetical protein